MPKAVPKNGYYYFMLDFRRREERAGRRFPGGVKDVADAASEEWRNMSAAEKDDYVKFAKENKDVDRPNRPKPLEKKFNSEGVCLAQIEREKQARERKERAMEEFVHDFVRLKSIGKPICLIISFRNHADNIVEQYARL